MYMQNRNRLTDVEKKTNGYQRWGSRESECMCVYVSYTQTHIFLCKRGRSIKMVRHRELFIYLFVCLFWLCWVFVAVCGLSLVAVSGVSSETILYDSVIMDTWYYDFFKTHGPLQHREWTLMYTNVYELI